MHLTPLGGDLVLLEPGEGLDPGDPDAYLTPLIAFLQRVGARRLIYDLASVPVLDPLYYGWLVQVSSACAVTGVEMVVANVHAPAAYGLAQYLEGDPPFACARDVDRAREGVVYRNNPAKGSTR